MSRKHYLLGTLAAAVVGFTTPVLANWDSPNSCYPSGPYVGIQGGYADTNWSDTEDFMRSVGYTARSVDDGAWGGRVFLGYDFNENFSGEIAYTYIDDGIDYSFSGPGKLLSGCLGHRAYDAILKMRIFLENGFSVYTKLGVARLEACDAFKIARTVGTHDPSTTNVTFGAGFGYCLTPNWITSADWQHFRGCDDAYDFVADVNLFSLSIAYKFVC